MYIPKKIHELYGQDHLWGVLNSWIKQKSVPQSIMLAGPYGCGKTTIARMLANSLSDNSADILEINAAEARGIDEVRGWAESVRFSPMGDAKVFIIDELHQMTNAAQSALLKVIENPPDSIYFILCTTEPHKLLPALASRCTRMEVKILDKTAGSELITTILPEAPQELVDYIYDRSGGHARDMVISAQMGVDHGITNINQLQNLIGVGPYQVEAYLRKLLDSGPSQDLLGLLEIPEEPSVANIIDRTIDAHVIKNPRLCPHYYEILMLRTKRKQYLISLREMLTHIWALMTMPAEAK